MFSLNLQLTFTPFAVFVFLLLWAFSSLGLHSLRGVIHDVQLKIPQAAVLLTEF